VGRALPIQPAGLEAELALIRRSVGAGESLQGLETRRLRRDGSLVDVSASYAPLYDEGGAVAGILAICVDVSDRKRAELALRAREKRFRAVFDSAHAAILILDDDRSIVDANEAAALLYGVARVDLVGQSIDALAPAGQSEQLEDIWRACLEHGEATGDWELVRPDGALRHVEYSLKAGILPGRHLAMLRDVTDRQELETQLLRSQRMEAVGRLTGGIAHDFNNLLTAITGYSDFLLRELDPGSTALRDAQEIARAAERAAALVNQLLAFSRRQVTQPRVLDLNEIVRETETMLQRLIGEDIALVTRLSPKLPPVVADPAQMEQMIINLAVNARDAIPDGGRLEIDTAEVELAEERAAALSLPAGRYAHVRVADDGSGMDERTRLQAFEPFFTTKEHGSGLGLATVYGIVTGAGGQIELDSEPGRGTTFSICLPATAQPVHPAGSDPAADRVACGSETVLLVEDDDMVRHLALRVLASSGYRVLQAACGQEALEVAAASGEPIDVLLSDVVMPGMGGRELAERLRKTRPETRVVFMSGYTEDPSLAGGEAPCAEVFVVKPFTPAALARSVRAALDAEGTRERPTPALSSRRRARGVSQKPGSRSEPGSDGRPR
jgi:two-component system cell cycle sensor histidine kinase/response regulator CckA